MLSFVLNYLNFAEALEATFKQKIRNFIKFMNKGIRY